MPCITAEKPSLIHRIKAWHRHHARPGSWRPPDVNERSCFCEGYCKAASVGDEANPISSSKGEVNWLLLGETMWGVKHDQTHSWLVVWPTPWKYDGHLGIIIPFIEAWHGIRKNMPIYFTCCYTPSFILHLATNILSVRKKLEATTQRWLVSVQSHHKTSSIYRWQLTEASTIDDSNPQQVGNLSYLVPSPSHFWKVGVPNFGPVPYLNQFP